MIANKFNLIIITVAIIVSTTLGFQLAHAAPITLDIHKAKVPGPGFTSDSIGKVTITPDKNKLTISADITDQPKQDKVFEAWLGDDSGYKLSLGQVVNGHLSFSETMVNPYTYEQFLITQEPVNDKDPRATDTYAGIDLPPPFGQ